MATKKAKAAAKPGEAPDAHTITAAGVAQVAAVAAQPSPFAAVDEPSTPSEVPMPVKSRLAFPVDPDASVSKIEAVLVKHGAHAVKDSGHIVVSFDAKGAPLTLPGAFESAHDLDVKLDKQITKHLAKA